MPWPASVRVLCPALGLMAMLCGGCVRRTILVTSDPPGALVYLNDTEVGRTPIEVDFLYYGEYDVRLVKEGFEPIVTSADANAPIWDMVGIDLIAEAIPGETHSRVHWHYPMFPRNDDPTGLVDRAAELRGRLAPPDEAATGQDDPHATPEASQGAANGA